MLTELLQVPRVGGRELDLHLLYCSVTGLGGCKKVITHKQWRVRRAGSLNKCVRATYLPAHGVCGSEVTCKSCDGCSTAAPQIFSHHRRYALA